METKALVDGHLLEEVQTDLQCIKPLVANVETNVKYRLNQAEGGLFSVASVLKAKALLIQGGMEEEILADLVLTINECIKPSVINAEAIVMFRFSLQAESQSIAASVLKAKMIGEAGIRNNIGEAGILNNIRNSLKH